MTYSEENISLIKEGGLLLGEILEELANMVAPGVTTLQLDEYAEQRIRQVGGEPSFLGYTGGGDVAFPSTVCISINEEVVHGPAVPSRVLQEGDIVSIDIGMRYKGFCTDTALTVPVGKIYSDQQKLIDVTYESLRRGIAQAKSGNKVNHIAAAVQNYVESFGYSVVRALVGHGVGLAVHEEPEVPNYTTSNEIGNYQLHKGLVIAIEPMVNVGKEGVKTLDDGWTVVTKDGKLAAHFEHTVAITENGVEVLTKRPSEKF